MNEYRDPEAASLVPQRVEARIVDEVRALADADEAAALVGQLSQRDRPGRDVGADGLSQALGVILRFDTLLQHSGAHQEPPGVGSRVAGRDLSELRTRLSGQDEGRADADPVHQRDPRVDLLGRLRVRMAVHVDHRDEEPLDLRARDHEPALGLARREAIAGGEILGPGLLVAAGLRRSRCRRRGGVWRGIRRRQGQQERQKRGAHPCAAMRARASARSACVAVPPRPRVERAPQATPRRRQSVELRAAQPGVEKARVERVPGARRVGDLDPRGRNVDRPAAAVDRHGSPGAELRDDEHAGRALLEPPHRLLRIVGSAEPSQLDLVGEEDVHGAQRVDQIGAPPLARIEAGIERRRQPGCPSVPEKLLHSRPQRLLQIERRDVHVVGVREERPRHVPLAHRRDRSQERDERAIDAWR